MSVARKKNCVTSKLDTLNSLSVNLAGKMDCVFVTGKRKTVATLPVKSCVVTHVPFAGGLPQKKGINPDIAQHPEIKSVKDVSCVGHWSFVQNVTNVPIVAIDLPVRARLHQFWGKMGRLGGRSQNHKCPQGRLHSPLPVLAKSS